MKFRVKSNFSKWSRPLILDQRGRKCSFLNYFAQLIEKELRQLVFGISMKAKHYSSKSISFNNSSRCVIYLYNLTNKVFTIKIKELD